MSESYNATFQPEYLITPDENKRLLERRREISGRWHNVVKRFGWGGLTCFPSNPNIPPSKYWEHKNLTVESVTAFLADLGFAIPRFLLL